MAKDSWNFDAPVTVSADIHITDGERHASVDYVFPVGVIPTEEKVGECIASVLEHCNKELGGEWRTISKEEFWKKICVEKTGIEFAMPGNVVWGKFFD